ncbi:cl repressor [Salmonella phage 41]|nr:cl repressor [Salmonella phage 41]
MSQGKGAEPGFMAQKQASKEQLSCVYQFWLTKPECETIIPVASL